MKSLVTALSMFMGCIAFGALAAGMAAAEDQKAEEKPTFAERLGWPEGARVMIFHCDDAGMCHSANVGAIEAMEKGVCNSVSTMMPCSWVPEFAAYLKEHPDVDNGIHVTLTSEWDFYRWGPLAGKPAAPGLVDEQGCLWDNVPLVVQHASAAEVEIEIRAQVERAERMGMPITHIDTHMGTVYAKPEYFLAYMKVGVEKNIPIMIPGGHNTLIGQENPEAVKSMENSGIPEAVWNAGLPVLDDLCGMSYDWKEYPEKKAKTIELIRNLKPGVTQFIVHCTRPGDEFEFISPSGGNRLNDLKLMLDPDIKKTLEEEGIILTTWREMKQRRDAVGKAE